MPKAETQVMISGGNNIGSDLSWGKSPLANPKPQPREALHLQTVGV